MAIGHPQSLQWYGVVKGGVPGQPRHLLWLAPQGPSEMLRWMQRTLLVEHGLSCKKGGFMGQWHDDVCEELAHSCSMALTPARISSKPEIFYGRVLNVAQRRNADEVTALLVLIAHRACPKLVTRSSRHAHSCSCHCSACSHCRSCSYRICRHTKRARGQ